MIYNKTGGCFLKTGSCLKTTFVNAIFILFKPCFIPILCRSKSLGKKHVFKKPVLTRIKNMFYSCFCSTRVYTRKACSTLYYFCWHQHISSFVFDFWIVKMAFVIFINITYWNSVAARPFLCPTATREVTVLLRTFTWASTPCAESASLARVSACTYMLYSA